MRIDNDNELKLLIQKIESALRFGSPANDLLAPLIERIELDDYANNMGGFVDVVSNCDAMFEDDLLLDEIDKNKLDLTDADRVQFARTQITHHLTEPDSDSVPSVTWVDVELHGKTAFLLCGVVFVNGYSHDVSWEGAFSDLGQFSEYLMSERSLMNVDQVDFISDSEILKNWRK